MYEQYNSIFVNQHKFIYTQWTVKTKYIFAYADIEASMFFSPISKYCGEKYQKFSLQNDLITVLLNLTTKAQKPLRIKAESKLFHSSHLISSFCRTVTHDICLFIVT